MKSWRLFIFHFVMIFVPPTRCFALKRALLRFCGATIGNNARIASSARFYLTGPLEIGPSTWVGHEVMILGGAVAVTIGANVDIGPRVMIVTGSHRLWENPDRAAGSGFSKPIIIQDGSWVGAGAIILGGVTIGEASMVAAGALVRQDVAPHTAVAGVPAQLFGKTTEHQ